MSVQRRPVPKDMPTPLGSIPYGRFSRSVGDIVYSLDMFRARFPLRWGALRIKSAAGEFLPLTDDNVYKAVCDSIVLPLFELVDYVPSGGDARRRGALHWWSFDGVILTLYKYRPFGIPDPVYSLTLEFNPNKRLDNPVILALIDRIKSVCADRFCWCNTRLDYTIDVPYPISDVRLLSRKVGSTYEGTYYFGRRGDSGYTRVYDKRRQMMEVFHTDIGTDVTRIEYETRNGVPCVMDAPYRLGDLGKHGVLRYVPMSDWPAALRCYDPKTSRKIKQDCLYAIFFDVQIFDDLRDQFFAYLGLSMDDNIDRIESRRLDEAQRLAEASDLELLASSIRKFAKVAD